MNAHTFEVTFEGGPFDGRVMNVNSELRTITAVIPAFGRKPEQRVEYQIVKRWKGCSHSWVGVLK